MRVGGSSAPAAAEHDGEKVGSLVVGGGTQEPDSEFGLLDCSLRFGNCQIRTRLVVGTFAGCMQPTECLREVAEVRMKSRASEPFLLGWP